MGRTRLVALALTAAALAIGGCGSSTKTLSRAELTAKANAICKQVNAELTAINKKSTTEKDIAHIAPRLAAFEQKSLTELSKLTPPSELAEDWKALIANGQTLEEDTAKVGEYAKENNMKGALAGSLITSSQKAQQEIKATATRDGFVECEQAA